MPWRARSMPSALHAAHRCSWKHPTLRTKAHPGSFPSATVPLLRRVLPAANRTSPLTPPRLPLRSPATAGKSVGGDAVAPMDTKLKHRAGPQEFSDFTWAVSRPLAPPTQEAGVWLCVRREKTCHSIPWACPKFCWPPSVRPAMKTPPKYRRKPFLLASLART